MGYKDYGIFPNHMLMNISKNLDDMENQFKEFSDKGTKKQFLIEAAVQ